MDVSSESENLLPCPEWDLEMLASYTRDRFAMAEFFGRKTALQLWRAGQALLLVKEKLKAERKWTAWAQENDLPLTSAYEAIKIAERFESAEDLTGLTTIEAKMIAGTLKPRTGRKPQGDEAAVKTRKAVTSVMPRDETPVNGGTTTAEATPGTRDVASDFRASTATERHVTPNAEKECDSHGETREPERSVPPAGWFEQLREELQDEIAEIEDTILIVQEWATRQNHPMSAALLRVLIESEQIDVLFDEGKEVVRVDDYDLIAALAAAEAFLDPIFSRLGITPEIAARHLLEMVQEGRGLGDKPKAFERANSASK